MAPADYVFIDEWDVDAPLEAVFEALADATTYPKWWTPTYLAVQADGPLRVGQVSEQKFKGKLPYTLSTTSRITRLEPPREFEVEVEGDLRGTGIWTLTPAGGRVHVRFDWRVHADRALIRVLTPILRPLFRWNHNIAISCAQRGLESYARRPAVAASA
jgi:uncharacterized protein YndB with AHSA1/START domain